jgi:hypothetical protein
MNPLFPHERIEIDFFSEWCHQDILSSRKESVCCWNMSPLMSLLSCAQQKRMLPPSAFCRSPPPGGRRAMLRPPIEKLQVQAFFNRDRKIKQIWFAWYCCWVAACICDQCQNLLSKVNVFLQLKQTERDTISRALLPVRVLDMTKTDKLSYYVG